MERSTVYTLVASTRCGTGKAYVSLGGIGKWSIVCGFHYRIACNGELGDIA